MNEEDPRSEVTSWLLEVVAERYNVILRPMEPTFAGIDGKAIVLVNPMENFLPKR